MAKSRLYQSEKWLTRQYLVNKLTPEEIAAKADCTLMTVYTYLKKYGLKK